MTDNNIQLLPGEPVINIYEHPFLNINENEHVNQNDETINMAYYAPMLGMFKELYNDIGSSSTAEAQERTNTTNTLLQQIIDKLDILINAVAFAPGKMGAIETEEEFTTMVNDKH